VEDSAARGAPPGDDDGENGDGAEENGREEKSASLSVAAAAPPSAAARSPSAAERKEILKMVTRWGHTVDLDPALAGNKRDANPKRRELLKRDLSREIKWIDMVRRGEGVESEAGGALTPLPLSLARADGS
jgi:hypothetical protein